MGLISEGSKHNRTGSLRIISEAEEGRGISGQKTVYKPSKEEWDEHERFHIPFRKWCPFCAKGRCEGAIHKRTETSEEEIEREAPVISMDYMGNNSGGGGPGGEWSEKVD